jgi:non-heme chloroperoxidase
MPTYGYNRLGAEPSEAIIENWWRQGMTGGVKAHYDGVVAFSQTDFTDDPATHADVINADLLAFVRS